MALGNALARDGRFAEAADILVDSWRHRDHAPWSPGVTLQIGGNLGLSLLELGRVADLDAFLREAVRSPTGPNGMGRCRRAGAGDAATRPGSQPLSAGRRRRRASDAHPGGRARRTRRPADVDVLALVFLADAELGCGDRAAARAALARARENVDDEPVTPFAMRLLQDAETRIGRIAVRSARRSGVLAEELTDRELSILRMLPGSASQREIGQAMFLSVNTVKAYNKSLYRKLGVASRQEAVAAARELGLI